MSSAASLPEDRQANANERLNKLIRDACAVYPNRADFSKRKAYIEQFLFGEMTYVLFVDQPPTTLGMELGRRINQLRKAGEIDKEESNGVADTATTKRGGGHSARETQDKAAAAPSAKHGPPVESLQAAHARIRAQSAENRLYRMIFNNKPLARNYVFELRRYIDMLNLRIMNDSIMRLFLQNLVANLDGSVLIGDHYKDAAEIEAIWQRAEAVHVPTK
jgi:hypothetical protein